MMFRIQRKSLRKRLAIVIGWSLLTLITVPLVADDGETDDASSGTTHISEWGPVGISAKGGSFEVDLIARLFTKGFYAELDYGESDVDLPAVFGGGNVDVSYWTLGIRGYPWVEHGVGGLDFAFFMGASLGRYDLDSPLGPLTGAHAGFDLRAGLEIRASSVPRLGVEVEWVSHQIDVSGEDLEFDGFLFGVRYHWGTGDPVND